jgi:hypothetical protein
LATHAPKSLTHSLQKLTIMMEAALIKSEQTHGMFHQYQGFVAKFAKKHGYDIH